MWVLAVFVHFHKHFADKVLANLTLVNISQTCGFVIELEIAIDQKTNRFINHCLVILAIHCYSPHNFNKLQTVCSSFHLKAHIVILPLPFLVYLILLFMSYGWYYVNTVFILFHELFFKKLISY